MRRRGDHPRPRWRTGGLAALTAGGLGLWALAAGAVSEPETQARSSAASPEAIEAPPKSPSETSTSARRPSVVQPPAVPPTAGGDLRSDPGGRPAVRLAATATAAGGSAPPANRHAPAATKAAGGAALPADAPRRVVSINLCTDQLAMLTAAPGQLLSVSDLALDPRASAMRDEARAHRINHGRAEEIYLLRPDLVLAGVYSSRHTVEMLRRLGLRVEEFPLTASFDEVRANIRRMGALLGRPARAEALIAGMDARLEAARPSAAETGAARPLAALRQANSWTSGAGTLSNAILEAAGLRNLGAEAGLVGGGALPLEALIMGKPDLLIVGEPYAPPSLAEQGVMHPALRPLAARAGGPATSDSDWVCGAPFAARAVEALAQARRALPARMAEAGAPGLRPMK